MSTATVKKELEGAGFDVSYDLLVSQRSTGRIIGDLESRSTWEWLRKYGYQARHITLETLAEYQLSQALRP